MPTYNLTVIHQVEELHIFNEIVGAFAYGLSKMGHKVFTSANAIRSDAINIVFAAHISPESVKPQLPPDTIIYNTEQLGSVWMRPEYIKLLQNFKVWDYSLYNTEVLKREYGLKNISFNPVGYCPLLERITHTPEENKDIDVLMYGSVNERRRHIIQSLSNHGLKAMLVHDAFGEDRDKLIARSRIVLNVHYYPNAVLETVRLSYLLNNRCFVITEKSIDWKKCEPYWFTMVMSEYNWLVEDCLEYINAPKRRQNVADCGHLLFSEYKQENIINEI